MARTRPIGPTAAVLASGGLFVAAYPPFDFRFAGLFATLPFALLALDPRASHSPLRLALAGGLFGWIASLGIVGHWMFLAAHDYFARSLLASAAFTLLVTATNVAVFYLPVLPCAYALRRSGPGARIAGFASVWIAAEYLRAELLSDNAWALLGQTFERLPLLRQGAEVGGVWLLGWVAAATGAALAVAWLERGKLRARTSACVWALCLPLGLAAYGWLALHAGQDDAAAARLAPLKVGIVQADIGKDELWKPGLSERHLERHLALSRSAALAGADLIVWPENAVPLLLDANPAVQRRIAALADEIGASFIVGSERSEQRGEGKAARFVSAFLFRPGADGYEVYDKIKLLPYIEEVPRWTAWFSANEWDPSYTAGKGPALFEVKAWRVAPLICFEAIYPRYAQAAASLGADLLLNLSNDSWFDRGAGPEQHFSMIALRAVEQRLPLVRAANSGVSAALDWTGAVAVRLASRREAVAMVEVRPSPRKPWRLLPTESFAWMSFVLAAWLVAKGSRAKAQPHLRHGAP